MISCAQNLEHVMLARGLSRHYRRFLSRSGPRDQALVTEHFDDLGSSGLRLDTLCFTPRYTRWEL